MTVMSRASTYYQYCDLSLGGRHSVVFAGRPEIRRLLSDLENHCFAINPKYSARLA